MIWCVEFFVHRAQPGQHLLGQFLLKIATEVTAIKNPTAAGAELPRPATVAQLAWTAAFGWVRKIQLALTRPKVQHLQRRYIKLMAEAGEVTTLAAIVTFRAG